MEYSNKLDEVDLAWDHLQEAKSVLQQIESKLNSEEDEHFSEPRVRECLQFETRGCSVQNTFSLSDEGNSPQRPAPMNISRLGTQLSLSQSWDSSSSRSNSNEKVDYVLENDGSSRRMFWTESINSSYKHVTDHASQLSAVRQTMKTADHKSSDNQSARIIPTRFEELAEWDVSEKGCYKAHEQDACNQSYKCYLEGEPPVGNGADLVFDHCDQEQMLQERKSSPDALVAGSSLGPPGSPLIQCLELKQSKSPTNKLERLKERIRAQRKLQKEQQFVKTNSSLPQEQSIPFLRQKTHKEGLEKCLVRKVTFGPPAPAYKGFNAVKLIPEVESCTGVEKSEGTCAGNSPISSRGCMRHRVYGHQEADSRVPISIPGQRRKHQQNSGRDHEATRKPQSCSKIISPKEHAKVNNGSSSSDVFSWKQGQKLIRMLLGPLPKRQQSPSAAPGTNDSNSQYLPGEKVKYPKGRARSPSFERSPGRRLYAANEDGQRGSSTGTGSLDSSQPGVEGMLGNGTLAGLQSGKPAGMNLNFTWKTGDDNTNEEGTHQGAQKNLATPKGAKYEDEHGGPKHWRTGSPNSCAVKRKPCVGIQRRPWPAGHGVGSSSPLQNKAEVENREQRARSPMARSYNADEVRQYMSRQVAKRRRKESERKLSVKQAMEMKKRRLQEVYRRQKEAVSKQKKGRHKATLPAHRFVEGYRSSAQSGKSLGSTQPMKDRTPTRGRPESGDLEKSGSYRQELKNLTGSSRNSLPGQCNPLRVQDLDPLACSPKLSSPSLITSRSLAAHEQEPNCSPTPCKGSQYRGRQQRLEGLRSMARTLSSRIEDEARRLGMETGILPGSGGRDGSQERKRGGLDGPVRPDAAAMLAHGDGPEWQGMLASSLVTSPSLPTDFSLLPNSLRKELGRVEADRPEDKHAENQTDLEVKELVDELLRCPSSQSDDFLWSDSETWSERELICSPRESGDGLLDEVEGSEEQSDEDPGTLSKGKHWLERETSVDEPAFHAPQPASGSLRKRGSWETGNMQDGNKPLIQNSKRLSSHWSPSRTMPSSFSGDKESVTAKECGILERSCYYVSSQPLRNSRSGKPFSDSRTAINPRKVTTNEMVKRNEDPVTQRLAELMKQLQEETEELRMKTPLKGDSALEMKRSLTSPDSTEHLKISRSRAGAEISAGTTHTSATHGSPMKDKLMEQSLWSLLPSESHYRQTMERIKNLRSGDGSVPHTPSTSFSKWEETGRPIFGNHDAFSRFTLEMAHQYLKEEDLRARHQAALFRLREKALKEKTKAELAWLEHQKIHLQNKGQDDKRPVIVRKQREVLLKLQKEKAEIRHLQNACRLAHQERKLLLKQQQEIFRIHQSTAHLQWQLGRAAARPWFSGEKDTSSPPAADGESTQMASPLPDPDVGCPFPQPLSEREGSLATEQLKEIHRKLDERFLPKAEEEVFRQQKQTSSVLAWKHSSDTEETVVQRTGTETLATWGPQVKEQVPSIWGPSTETDNGNAVEYSSNPESSKHLEINKMMMSAADVSLDELNGGQQTVKPAEFLKPICTVLEPSGKLMMKASKIQSEKDSVRETSAESTDEEPHISPLRRGMVSHRVKLGSIQSEQRRRQRERLKMEEAELCRQLEVYDAFISKTQAELCLDTDVNQVLKPQVKTPAAAQYKPQMDFPRPHRSNLLRHSAKQDVMALQSQGWPSEQDEKVKDVAKSVKPQEAAGAEDLTSAGNSEFDEKSSHVPNTQLSPPSHAVEEMQNKGTHPGTSTLSVSPEWPGHLDVTTDKSGQSPNSKEEILQDNGPDSLAFNITKSSNSLLSTNSFPKQNATLFPSKQEEWLFQRRLELNSDDFWSNFSTRAADHSSQNTCEGFLSSNTKLKADHGEEFDSNQSSIVVINEKGFKENGFGSHVFLANISGFMPSSNQQPALGLRANRLANETSGREGIAAESPLRRSANICEQASVLPLINSHCSVKEDADLAHCQQTAARDSWTAEVISPASLLVFNDGFPSTDNKSEGLERDLFCKKEVQSSVKGTNEILPPLPQEENSSGSEAVEEVTSCSKDQASLAEGCASESVELPLLNAEGVLHRQQDLLPVLKSGSKMEVLAIPLIDTSAQTRRIPPVEEISFINEELPSPAEGDNPLNTKEMSSPVVELIVHEADVSSSPTERTISFETEEFPPLPEEIIMLLSKELPSPSRGNSIVHIEDFSPSSANNSLIYESSVRNKNNGVNTDEFIHPPLPVEKIVEERKSIVTENYKYPLRSSRVKENLTEFHGNNLWLEPSRVLLPQTRQQIVEPLSCSTIKDQELADVKKADSLKFKGHTSFGQDYRIAAELDKPKAQHDGAFCELKYKECAKKCDIPITPEDLFHHWDMFDVNTDVTDSEGSFSEGSPILNQQDADDYLKQTRSSEAEFEMVKEKVIASQKKDKIPILDQSNRVEAHWNSNNDLELERIILECAKAVESFADSEHLLDAEVEPKSHLEDNLNSEGLVRSWADQQLVGKGSEKSLNDTEGFLTQYLVEGTLGEVTIRDQGYHSTQKKLSQCQIKRHSTELTQRNSQTLQRQRDLDRSYKEMTGLLRMDLIQLQDTVRIAKKGSYKETIENMINYLITEFIDEAAKEYKKIKRKHTGNTEAKLILYSQPAVECLTQLKMVHNARISGNSPDIGNRKLKGTKTHGQKFLLDHWCSVPWRRSEETTFVVPHNFTEIQHWVGNSVSALWSQRGQLQAGDGINVLECQKDIDEMEADGKNKKAYKQAIFDLTSDIFQNALKKEPKNTLDPWMKARPQALFYPGHALNKEDKTEVTHFIQDKVTKLLNLDRSDLEKRRKIQKLTKYNKSKRDRVDIILIQELQEEESHWIEYADDELALKLKLTEDIFNILLHDTADTLTTIYGKKLAEQELISSST